MGFGEGAGVGGAIIEINMRVLVVGSGGREHAIAWKLNQSPRVTKIFCAPGNAGIANVAECVAISATDVPALLKFAVDHAIDLTVVGPETPLVAGIVDTFLHAGLKIVGPKKYAAQLEGSKQFAKAFMRRHGIPTAAYQTFTHDKMDSALLYLATHELPVVIKADGLAAGKGVVVAATRAEAFAAVESMLSERTFGDAGATIVIEEFLVGEEASVFAMCDGKNYVTFAPAQDHKRIGDGDTGKNTGGMGAFAPARIVTPQLLEQVKHEVIEPVLRGMKEEGCAYTGFLYCGLMIGPDGPKVVEFNCRLGDPETQVVLPLLDCDFAELCVACAEGRIGEVAVSEKHMTAVCVVMAAKGYPDAYQSGAEISGLEKFSADEHSVVFHAGTKFNDGKIMTAGGRVLGVTAMGETLPQTITYAYAAVRKISFKGATWRKDIGEKGMKYE